VAVVVVVLYHCGLAGFSGGFVGVDVFFALSGYLMTGLLLAEHQRAGTIGLRAFYARRIRRLLPASTLVALVTLVAGWIVLDPLSARRLADDAVGVATYTANMRFAASGSDYLQADTAESALLHYWSLAVEEQFYLVWPVLLLLAAGRRRTNVRRVGIALGVLAVGSFAASVVLLDDHPVWTFYGLHARAWEFAVGGLAAIIGARIADNRMRAVTGWFGMALIVACVVWFDETTSFPALGAVPAVLGTVLVLDAHVARRGPSALLSLRPMVWIGGRSYSIYLWHWPPLVLVPHALGEPLGVWTALGIALAASVVAVVVQRLVEDPVRFSPALARRPLTGYALAAMLMVTTLGAAGALRAVSDVTGDGEVATDPVIVDGQVVLTPADTIPALPPVTEPASTDPQDGPTPESTTAPTTAPTTSVPAPQPAPANLTPALADVALDAPIIYADGCHADTLVVEPLDCAYGDLDADRTMVLFGDSHAAQWFPALEQMARDTGWRLVPLTKSGCPSAEVTIYNPTLERAYDECDAWRARALERIEAAPPDLVVVANLPRHTLADGTLFDDPTAIAAWRSGLDGTLTRLEATGAEIVMIGTLPRPGREVPTCVAENLDDVTDCSIARPEAVDSVHGVTNTELAAEHDAVYLDPADWVCGPDQCPVVIGRYLVYRDRTHLTTAYSAFLAPVLQATGAFD
jgi:peptidoglycan/LPS O-acetylase OafA/YrhL